MRSRERMPARRIENLRIRNFRRPSASLFVHRPGLLRGGRGPGALGPAEECGARVANPRSAHEGGLSARLRRWSVAGGLSRGRVVWRDDAGTSRPGIARARHRRTADRRVGGGADGLRWLVARRTARRGHRRDCHGFVIRGNRERAVGQIGVLDGQDGHRRAAHLR